jgi:hypothetical protein
LRIAGSQDLVRAAVASRTGWRLLLAVLSGGGMNPELISVHGIAVAGRALRRHDFLRSLHFMRFSMATCAGVST